MPRLLGATDLNLSRFGSAFHPFYHTCIEVSADGFLTWGDVFEPLKIKVLPVYGCHFN